MVAWGKHGIVQGSPRVEEEEERGKRADTHGGREDNSGCLHGEFEKAGTAEQSEVGGNCTGATARGSGKAKTRADGRPKGGGVGMEGRTHA